MNSHVSITITGDLRKQGGVQILFIDVHRNSHTEYIDLKRTKQGAGFQQKKQKNLPICS